MLLELRPNVNPQSYDTWLRPTRFARVDGDALVITVPSADFSEMIEEKFAAQIAKALEASGNGFHRVIYEWPKEDSKPAEVEVEQPKEESRPDPFLDALSCPTASEDAFYGPAKAYRDLLSARTEPSDNFHLACFLTVMGAALGRSVYVVIPGTDGPTYPNQYAALIGTSSWSRKGTAIRFSRRLLDVSKTILKLSSIDSAEGNARAVRDWVDGSQSAHRGGVLFEIEEFNSVLAKASQKGSKIIPDLKANFNWSPRLQLNSSVNRVNIEDPPTLSILTASETKDLDDMRKRDTEGGLGNRIVFVPGVRKIIERQPAPKAEEWESLRQRLALSVKFWVDRGETEIGWTDDALAIWDAFYKRMEQRCGDDPLVGALAGRHSDYVVKISTVHAAFDRLPEIEPRHIEAAISYADFLLKSLYYVFRRAQLRPDVQESMEIVDYVRRHMPAGIRYRDLQKRFWRLGPQTFEWRMKFLLCDKDHFDREFVMDPRRGKSGRVTDWVVMNV